MEKNNLYPIFIDLREKRCLVIGGGMVAERKIASLIAYGAVVTVVSPKATPIIKAWADEGLVNWLQREFEPQDIELVFMVFIATDKMDINREVAALCRARQIMVNSADDPENCDFYVPSVLQRGALSIAISTAGKSPLLARRLKEYLAEVIGTEYGEYVELLGELRVRIKEQFKDMGQRRAVFESIIDLDILSLLKDGQYDEVKERVEKCISSWLE